jgi:hypothetical protein
MIINQLQYIFIFNYYSKSIINVEYKIKDTIVNVEQVINTFYH